LLVITAPPSVSTQARKAKFHQFCELDGAICEEDGDAVDHGIPPFTAEAEKALRRDRLKLQRLMAHRADDPSNVFGFHRP
jgi:hypothetical protein